MPSHPNGIRPFVDGEVAGRNGLAADAVEAVTPGDEVAPHLVFGAGLREADHRTARRVRRPTRRRPRSRAGGRWHTRASIRSRTTSFWPYTVIARPPVSSAMSMRWRRPCMLTIEAVVAQAALPQSRAHAHRDQQVHGPLLKDAGAHAVDHVVAASVLDDDRVHAVEMQQVPQQQPGRTGADDSNLCAVNGHLRTTSPRGRRSAPRSGGRSPAGARGRSRPAWRPSDPPSPART